MWTRRAGERVAEGVYELAMRRAFRFVHQHGHADRRSTGQHAHRLEVQVRSEHHHALAFAHGLEQCAMPVRSISKSVGLAHEEADPVEGDEAELEQVAMDVARGVLSRALPAPRRRGARGRRARQRGRWRRSGSRR